LKNNKTNLKKDFNLPELNLSKTFGIGIVNRAMTVTILIIIGAFLVAAILINFIKINITTEATGVLEPLKVKIIHAPTTGILNEVLVNSGDSVKTNQLLMSMDSSALFETLKNIESKISSIKLNIERTKINLDISKRENKIQLQILNSNLLNAFTAFREQVVTFYSGHDPDSLFRNYKVGTHIGMDRAVAQIRIVQARIENERLNFDKLKAKELDLIEYKNNLNLLEDQKKDLLNKIKQLKIFSPTTGVVLTNGLENLKGTLVNKGALLCEISEPVNWEVTLFLSERDIHKVNIGDSVKLEFTALKNEDDFKLYKGIIIKIAADKIANSFRYQQFTGMYRLTAKILTENSLEKDLRSLKRGFSVKANIFRKSGTIWDIIAEKISGLIN